MLKLKRINKISPFYEKPAWSGHRNQTVFYRNDVYLKFKMANKSNTIKYNFVETPPCR